MDSEEVKSLLNLVEPKKSQPLDEEELKFSISTDVDNKVVVIDFGTSINWVSLPLKVAEDIINKLQTSVDTLKDLEGPKIKTSNPNKLKEITLYTDGACEGNPGKGGYGALLYLPDQKKRFSGSYRLTTNNRMELIAVIKPLIFLSSSEHYENMHITIYTDSQYVANAFNKKWLKNWKRNNWKKADGNPVLNKDLWEALDSLTSKTSFEFKWIRGHSEHPENEECDRMAVDARTNPEILLVDKNYEEWAEIQNKQ